MSIKRSAHLSKVLVINNSSTVIFRVPEPQDECKFEHVVEWNNCENESNEMFQNVHTSEDNPVSKPFLNLFLIVTLRIKGDERVENWVSNTNSAGNVRLTKTENAAGCSEVQGVACKFG